MRQIDKESGSIICGISAWPELEKVIDSIQPYKIFVLVDTNTQKHCLPYFLEQAKFINDPKILVTPHGEENKNIGSCLDVWKKLSQLGADKNSLLINLGGGVVTDLGGFVASTFKRGINFINIPTSLLSMVDAAIGGKNGVDLDNLKNQIGVINNPEMVIVDTQFLQTLPKPQINSGMAEMFKHGLISSEKYWNEVASMDVIGAIDIESLVWESIKIKNEVVTEDPNEIGRRKTLNYGHTLGHAIESYCLNNKAKPQLLHGEAIAIGMILATYISTKTLSFPKEKLEKITKVLRQRYKKVNFNLKEINAIIELLIYDKKSSNGKVQFVLLEDFGKYKIDCEVQNKLIHKAFEFYNNFENN